jgi:hypothetical protein
MGIHSAATCGFELYGKHSFSKSFESSLKGGDRLKLKIITTNFENTVKSTVQLLHGQVELL